jgi:methionine synthase reductase
LKLSLDKLESWPSYPIIFATSSTGDGDPPENAETFWRQLRRKTKSDASSLDHVRFIILGLGDSNYDSYQGFPLSLYAKLTQLGAKPILAIAKADEATGSLEDFVEPWITDLWPDLETFFKTGQTVPVMVAPVAETPSKPVSSVQTPQTASPAPSSAVPTPSITPNPTNPSTTTTTATPATLTPDATTPAVLTPAASQLPTPSTTPVPTATAKAVRAPIVPKAPNHITNFQFLSSDSLVTSPAPRFRPVTFPPTKDAPYMAEAINFRTLTAPDAVKEVHEATFKISAGTILPGDAIGIWPENCPILTERLLNTLHITEPDRLFELHSISKDPKAILPGHIILPTTPRLCFQHYVNFNGLVSKRILVMLADYCTLASSKQAIMDVVMDKTKFKIEIEDCYASVLDILERYPDCKPNVGHLLDSLSPLMPRYFSISNFDSSSNPDDPSATSTFRFAFSVERHTLMNKTFHGVATNWLKYSLEKFIPGTSSFHAPIFVRPRGEFLLKNDMSRPIIMCSAGTGIAPFLGFFEQRRHYSQAHPTEEIGQAILFTGHRHPKMDWIYHEEVESAKLEKDIIHTAFSRHQPGNVQYVQDLMSQPEIGKQLIDLMLNQDAIWYICGDARKMATQVRETVLKLLQTHASLDSKLSSDKILEWAKGKRYLLDIWG